MFDEDNSVNIDVAEPQDILVVRSNSANTDEFIDIYEGLDRDDVDEELALYLYELENENARFVHM